MLSLSKRTDYALIALMHIAQQPPERPASAREVAEQYNLPPAMLMNILKTLHGQGIVRSTRGTKGGYQLAADLKSISLYQLIETIDGPVKMTECIVVESDCHEEGCCKVSRSCPVQGPIQALHHRLVKFLKDVKLSDLIVPGKRIDVPVELVGVTLT
ncbi:MAG: RrF2 family transcriptional regulator [Tepidisphaeraceae bacterium]